MNKREIVLCADSKCPCAKKCYYHEVDPATLKPCKIKVADTLNTHRHYNCEAFKLYQKEPS